MTLERTQFEAAVGAALAHHARDIVLLVHPDGHIAFGNEAAIHAYGRDIDQLTALSISDLRAPHTASEVADQMRRAASDGMLFETEHLRADGSAFPVEVSSRLVELGGERYLLSVIRDITHRRANEAERDELLRDLESANRQLEGLLRIISGAVGNFDVDALLAEVLAALREVMDADAALFFMADGDVWRLHAQNGYTGIEGLTMPIGSGFVSEVARTRDVEWVEDIRSTELFHPVHERYEIVAMLGVPLFLEGTLYGVLECTWREPRLVSEAARVMLRAAADRIMSAVAGARRYEVEHRIAETLQEAILRVDADVPGISVGHLYRSATLATRVGGDFYDVFPIGPGKVGIVVGDVSGKGLEAAVLTTLVKNTIRAFAHAYDSPADVLERANEVLLAAARLPDFASVAFFVLDTRTGQVDYCSGGHPPALVCRSDGEVELQACGSPVLGALPDLEFVTHTFEIGRDEIVVLYTDGVTEARSTSGEFFGDDRLVASMQSMSSDSVLTIPAQLNKTVMEFTGGRLSDDMAIVAFRWE